ncbi:MAG: YbbC/YhhH family protein [Candidatus Kapabacteria bacterium]|nr:YbbC/YhhH family protein [Candidatus Kapabacteria bacterium]
MRQKTTIISIIIIFGLIFCFLDNVKSDKINPNRSYVPDKETASKIAEIILLSVYGEQVNKQKPFKVTCENDSVWSINGVLPEPKEGYMNIGGVAHIRIRKKDCKILECYHTK